MINRKPYRSEVAVDLLLPWILVGVVLLFFVWSPDGSFAGTVHPGPFLGLVLTIATLLGLIASKKTHKITVWIWTILAILSVAIPILGGILIPGLGELTPKWNWLFVTIFFMGYLTLNSSNEMDKAIAREKEKEETKEDK